MLKLLIFSFMLEGGYQPSDYTLILNDAPVHAEHGIDNTWYLSISPRADFGPVYLSGGITTETDFAGSNSRLWGQPYQTTYDIEAGIRLKNVTLGASHMCSHSTFVTDDFFQNHVSMDDSHTRFFVRLKISTAAIDQ
jgi:hypothetical protein